MTKTGEYYAVTTDSSISFSILDEILSALRISGSILLREAYATPWSIAIPDHAVLSALLGASPGARVVAFHLVEFGHCTLQTDHGGESMLNAGEMAICFGGGPHHLAQGPAGEAMAVETLLSGGGNPRHPDVVGQTAGTALLCGAFVLHDTAFNPLFAALPAVLHAPLYRAGALHNLAGVARLMAEELDRRAPAHGYVVERLLEVLCAEALRAYMETLPQREANWFCGIQDPVVGKAIATLHARPGEAWTVPRLAGQVAMSPSRLSARFTEAVGDSPMAYLTKWRMNVACRWLRDTRLGIERIAADLGYDSQAAFSRTFRRHLGASPSAWRAGLTGRSPDPSG